MSVDSSRTSPALPHKETPLLSAPPVKVGLCGFTIGAARYFESYPALEVQQTFYEPPSLTTLSRWRQQAPSTFDFTIKAWQVITHPATSRTYRRMKTPLIDSQRKECGAFQPTGTVFKAWETTLRCARTLRASAILFQCPASFRAEQRNLDNMRSFFGRIERPSGLSFLWEPRGPWPDDIVLSLCKELGLIHAVDPFIRPSLTPELTYWRLHGNGSSYASYNDNELEQLRNWLPDGAPAYIMFNNLPRPQDSQRFMAMMSR